MMVSPDFQFNPWIDQLNHVHNYVHRYEKPASLLVRVDATVQLVRLEMNQGIIRQRPRCDNCLVQYILSSEPPPNKLVTACSIARLASGLS